MSIKYTTICAVLMVQSAFGQVQTRNLQQQVCGFDEIPATITDSPTSTPGARNTNVDTFDVVFHLLHLGQPIGAGGANISDEQVASALLSLNRDFQAWPIHDSIAIAPNGVNSEMYFRLACTAPDGSATNGINRINATDFPDYAIDGFNFKTNNAGNYQALADLSHWPQNRYINIWVTHKIQTFMNTLVAGGGFGPGNGVYQQGYGGVYLTYRHVGCDVDGSQGFDIFNPYGRLISHETGHFFGLLHTFQGESCTETDCQTQGDRVCDTEPHTNSVSNDLDCQDFIECSTREPVENLMNYSGITCGNIFTAGQKARMKMFITNFFQSLANQPACLATAVATPTPMADWRIYPNPASDWVSGTACSASYFRLSNTLGCVFTTFNASANGSFALQTGHLKPGMYFIEALNETGNVMAVRKLIKA